MKKLNFIVQAKGGVGKSLFMYLFALTKERESESLFIDVDASTQTSARQLKFLPQNRLDAITLLDEKEVLVRDNLISYLENLSKCGFQECFFDFGAPESEQLPALLERDLPFKEFADELGFEVVFHIVIAGGGAYKASVNYLRKMIAATQNQFQLIVWQNITSFSKHPELSQELASNCHNLGLTLKLYGDFEPSSNLGSQILDGVRKGDALENYQTGARLRLKRELKINFNHE